MRSEILLSLIWLEVAHKFNPYSRPALIFSYEILPNPCDTLLRFSFPGILSVPECDLYFARDCSDSSLWCRLTLSPNPVLPSCDKLTFIPAGMSEPHCPSCWLLSAQHDVSMRKSQPYHYYLWLHDGKLYIGGRSRRVTIMLTSLITILTNAELDKVQAAICQRPYQSRNRLITVTTIVCGTITYTAVAIRLVSRYCLNQRYGMDDWFIIVAAVSPIPPPLKVIF